METGRGERFKTRIEWLTRISMLPEVLMKVLEVVEDERQRIAEMIARYREGPVL